PSFDFEPGRTGRSASRCRDGAVWASQAAGPTWALRRPRPRPTASKSLGGWLLGSKVRQAVAHVKHALHGPANSCSSTKGTTHRHARRQRKHERGRYESGTIRFGGPTRRGCGRGATVSIAPAGKILGRRPRRSRRAAAVRLEHATRPPRGGCRLED